MTRNASDRTLVDVFERAPREAPFVTMWRPGRAPECETLTFGGFLGLAARCASLYCHEGLKPGDTVVLIMRQDIAVMAAFVGAMLLGAIPTILAYPTFKIDPEKYRAGLNGVTANIAARLVVLDREFPAGLREHIVGHTTTRVVQLDERSLEDAEELAEGPAVDADSVAFIQHSAGTTGLQKGVALSHRAVLNQLRHLSTALRLTRDDRIVSWLPLYHDMGLIACFVMPLAFHLGLVMESPTDWVLDPGSLLRLTTEFRCTLSWQPNFAFQFMARRVADEERERLDLSSLRAVINCSEPVRLESMREFYIAFRSRGLSAAALQSSYAMAENTFAVTQCGPEGVLDNAVVWADGDVFWREGRLVAAPPGPPAISFVSSGRCLDGNEARIVAGDGADLADGRLGDILIRSDSLFDGYYNRSDITRKAMCDGWYRTGDLGFRLDGEVYVVGRRDDTIIVGGKNIYPQDVEEVVFRHPAIHDGRAIAFGLYNPALGTQDLIIVAEVTDEVLLERCGQIELELRRAVLGEFGVAPRAVRLVPPKWVVKSTAGKPARSTNRRKFLREHPEYSSESMENVP